MAFTETLSHRPSTSGQRGPSRLLRLQSDERLVAQTRRGNDAAYETLVTRYQPRLLVFCTNMLRSREDAEDVLQEVFAAAYSAMIADDRPLNVRPWLYRIARNRSLNHLRRQTAIGVDSMDVHFADGGVSTAERAIEREEFRALLGDVHALAEQQRAALLLREIEGLSYDQIAEVLETTIPAVKSLLVRARVGLAEAAEARRLTCDEVRLELGQWAEGLQKISPPVRRHVKDCERCATFKAQLKDNNKVLAALFPLGPILLLQKLIAGHAIGHATGLGAGAGASAGTGAAATGGSGGLFTIGLTAGAGKAVATVATVAIVAGGAAEVEQIVKPAKHHTAPAAVASVRSASSSQAYVVPAPVASAPTASAPPQKQQPVTVRAVAATTTASTTPTVPAPAATTTTPAPAPVLVTSTEPVTTAQTPEDGEVEQQYSSTTLTTVQVRPSAPGLGPAPAAGLGPAPVAGPSPTVMAGGTATTPTLTTPTPTTSAPPVATVPITPTTPAAPSAQTSAPAGPGTAQPSSP